MLDSSPNETSSQISSDRYEPKELESRWQEKWEQDELYRTPKPLSGQKKFYALSMFPYPSGTLHMGHVRNYVITDVIARVQRMRGKAVLHPMGWDAFGLPAENAAIERGIDPATWTNQNIIQMRSQLKRLGLSVDWDREQATCEPDYYKWTQNIFLELFDAGLAYQKKASVNWDPVDKTVLANEQVDGEGRSWRSGAIVERRDLKQWFLKITEYADQLLNDIELLKGWPDRVKTMQKNWIGKSEGAEIIFHVKSDTSKKIEVFTTRADTLCGATYIVLAPDHSSIDEIMDENLSEEIDSFREKVKAISIKERTSNDLPKIGLNIGAEVINPANGETLPVWIADYVLSEYGSGAVMGVPAHDQRDMEFARKYKLPLKIVIETNSKEAIQSIKDNIAWTGEGNLVNSGSFNGHDSKFAKKLIIETGAKNKWAKSKVQFRIRDWLISRQRYWGCPIPIIQCPDCGIVKVPRDQLPVLLPNKSNDNKRINPVTLNNKEWINVDCPVCNAKAKRETDTMDTFMCSSWYFMRFTDPKNNSRLFDKYLADSWLPVDQYVGGIEHAILHLLYARFLTKALNNSGVLGTREPFKKLLTQGMVQSITYKNLSTGRYISPTSVSDQNNPIDPITGEKLEVLYEKMSKSKYNGVDPGIVIDKYGADTARMFILFKAPPEKDLEWNDDDVEGQYRFLQRIWKLMTKYSQTISFSGNEINYDKLFKGEIKLNNSDKELRRSVHTAIHAISNDLNGDYQFNTAIAELMKLSNKMNDLYESVDISVAIEALLVLIKLLAPFAPHMAEEIWLKLGGEGSIHKTKWPSLDKQALLVESYALVIQVKGKVRGRIEVSTSANKKEIEDIVLKSEISAKWLEGKQPSRVIVIPGKLVNLVP